MCVYTQKWESADTSFDGWWWMCSSSVGEKVDGESFACVFTSWENFPFPFILICVLLKTCDSPNSLCEQNPWGKNTNFHSFMASRTQCCLANKQKKQFLTHRCIDELFGKLSSAELSKLTKKIIISWEKLSKKKKKKKKSVEKTSRNYCSVALMYLKVSTFMCTRLM